jgi:putative hydrolase of the HAD superfamily
MTSSQLRRASVARRLSFSAPNAGRDAASRGLILDLDDTLYPYEEFVHSGFVAVARHLQEQHGIDGLEAFAALAAARRSDERGSELQVVCARYHLPIAAFVPTLLRVFREHPPVLRLSRRSQVTLRALRADGWRLAILTNGSPQVQRAKVSALGLTRLVDSVICAEEHAEQGKPAGPAFLEALARLDVPAHRAVCVGDDPACDIAGARNVGIRTVRVGQSRAIADGDADAVIRSLESLPSVAGQLLEAVTLDAA